MNVLTIEKLDFWADIEQRSVLCPITLENSDKELIKKINQFFNFFFTGISRENRSTHIIRSGHGATDLTYICHKYVEDEGRVLKFVTKYIHPALSANTRLCSAVFDHLGLQSPKLHVVDSTYCGFLPRGRIGTFMDVDKQKYKKHDFAFMNAFPGADIGNLIENQAFFQISEAGICSMFMTFGAVSVYDLMLGNDDRFYRPNLECIDTPSNVDPFLNSGNIMLEIYSPSTEKLEAPNIYCIDNTSSNRLTPFLSKKNEVEFDQEKQDYLTAFFKAFSYFKDHEQELALKIYEGIYQEVAKVKHVLTEEENQHCFFNKDLGVNSLAEGIKGGYQQLRAKKSELPTFMASCLDQIKPDEQGMLFCKKIIELADRCLQSLTDKESL